MPRPFGRRATSTGEPTAEQHKPSLRVLRADGQRIDLTAKNAGVNLAATRQPWQTEALAYRNLIGELRYAHRLLAHGVSKVRFYPAQVRPWPADPAPLDGDDHDLDKQLAADAVLNFERIPFDTDPAGFTGRLTENLAGPGEAAVHIDERDRFHVRSISEIAATQDGRVGIAPGPGAPRTAVRVIDPEREELLRCWVADPEWGQLADSPLRAALDACEDVVLAGREQRAAARSRVAANGILLMPDTLELVQSREDDDGDGVEADSFMQDFTEAMLASLKIDGDAQSVVPIVIRGDADDLGKVRHLTLQREESAKLIERQSTAILRLLKALDIQPEQVEGLGSVNHWTGWIIDSRSIRDQIGPFAEIVAACLTQAFLRPALLSLGHPEDLVDQILIVADPSPLAENPNRGQDARDAWDRFAISDDALRRDLGYDTDDAPEEAEVLRRMATQGRLPVNEAAELMGLRQPEQPAPQVVQGEVTTPALPAGEQDRPVARPGEVQAESPLPATQPQPGATPTTPGAVVAAALEAEPEDLLRVDEDLARRLADIDTALTDRILTAADATLSRIVEKAGARVRSAAQKDRALAARVTGMDAVAIPAAMGRQQVEAFVPVDDLLASGWDQLRAQFVRWVTAAGAEAALALADAGGLQRAERRALTARAEARLGELTEPAWLHLLAALKDAGEAALFPRAADADEPRGEGTDGLFTPADVVEALAVAAGESLAGPGEGSFAARPGRRTRLRPGASFTAGPVLARLAAEQGAVFLGWEWQYRAEILRDTYPDHRDLDGERFLSWTDPVLSTAPSSAWLGAHYRPQDHRGCRCVAARVLAWPTDPDGILGLRLREAAGEPQHLRPDPEPSAPAGKPRLRDRVLAAVEALVAKHITRRKRR